MRLTGKLRSWNNERGFGFIAPTHGGPELFVHISALPRGGSLPTVGEIVSYELGRGKDGQPQAVKVVRQAIGPIADRPRAVSRSSTAPGSLLPKVVALALVVALGGYGYHRLQQQATEAPQQPVSASREDSDGLSVPAYRCDGRIHCSQMTSCAEAKFFLKNCPGTQMDGNNDGEPCEQQWCTGLFAK